MEFEWIDRAIDQWWSSFWFKAPCHVQTWNDDDDDDDFLTGMFIPSLNHSFWIIEKSDDDFSDIQQEPMDINGLTYPFRGLNLPMGSW